MRRYKLIFSQPFQGEMVEYYQKYIALNGNILSELCSPKKMMMNHHHMKSKWVPGHQSIDDNESADE